MNEVRLQRVRFFEFLTKKERQEFVEESEPVSFRAGEEIIREGEDSASLFVLTSGQVQVHKSVPRSQDRKLATINADEENTVVGERGLLGESAASATVRTTSEVEAIRIPRSTFRRMISGGRPAAFKLSYRIARTLAQRLTRLDEQVAATIRDLEQEGETDLETFRDTLITDWSI